MIPKCCCNPAACHYVDDDFTLANETPVASPWSKLTGTDWNLASNVLDAVAAADYKNTTAFSGSASDARTAVVDFKLSADGDIEVQTGKTDENNYFAAKLTYAAGSCSKLTAFAYTGGSSGGSCTPGPVITGCVQVWGLTTGVWYRLRVCLIPDSGSYGYSTYDTVVAVISFPNDSSRDAISCQTSVDGPSVGTLSGLKTTMAAQFDNFQASYYRNSPSGQHRTCPWCHTACEISKDNFTSNEACLWDVVSGSYSVSGGVMNITADTSRIQHHIFHPGLKTTQQVTVDVKDTGIASRVYIGNGYAALTYSAGTYTLTLKTSGGTTLDTDAATVTADSSKWLALTLCYSRGVLSCTVTGHDGLNLCVDSPTTATDSAYWASLGGDNGAVFDNFVFSKTYDTTEPSDVACDKCAECPTECVSCIDGTINDIIVATIYGIGTGSGGDGPPPHYQCPWPMTGEDGSDINGTSWACDAGGASAFNSCCQWGPPGPTSGDGTFYRVWQSDFLIWNDCLHPCDTDPSNGSDPCGSDSCTGCGGLIPISTELGYKRVMRLSCVDICPNGDVWATVLIWSGVYNPPTTAVQNQQTVTFKGTLAGGPSPYDCLGNMPLRLDFWGLDGSQDYCGSDATEGGGTDNGYYDWSNAYIIIENA